MQEDAAAVGGIDRRVAANLRLHALPNILISNRILDRASRPVLCVLSARGRPALAFAARDPLGFARSLLAALMIGAYVAITDGFEPGALKRYLFLAWALLLLQALRSASIAAAGRAHSDWRGRRAGKHRPSGA